MNPLALIPVFFFAIAADWLSCEWQDARERGHLTKVGVIGAALELLTWIPLWFALVHENIWVAVVAVVGSVIGSVIGVHRYQKRKAADVPKAEKIQMELETEDLTKLVQDGVISVKEVELTELGNRIIRNYISQHEKENEDEIDSTTDQPATD